LRRTQSAPQESSQAEYFDLVEEHGEPNYVRSVNRVPVRFDQGWKRTYQDATARGIERLFPWFKNFPRL
jgi:hypothetical protein